MDRGHPGVVDSPAQATRTDDGFTRIGNYVHYNTGGQVHPVVTRREVCVLLDTSGHQTIRLPRRQSGRRGDTCRSRPKRTRRRIHGDILHAKVSTGCLLHIIRWSRLRGGLSWRTAVRAREANPRETDDQPGELISKKSNSVINSKGRVAVRKLDA